MSNNKRKSNDEAKGKKPAKLKRAGTMEQTAIEGNEFLEQEGATDLTKLPGGREGVETRGKQQARSTVNSLLSTSKNVTELAESDRKKEENKLKMVFRLFDKDKDGYMDADALIDALKSCGKKPTKAKVTALLQSVSGSKKSNQISSDEFVAYMMTKLFKVKKEKAEKKETKKTPAKEKKTPEKSEKKGEKEKEKEKEPAKETGKKKEKKETPKKETAPEKPKDAEKEDVTKPMERTRSITEFYTEHAGMNTEIVAEKLDKFSNPAGVEYDLGQEGAFNGFKILIGSFCNEFTRESFEANPKNPLQTKGFDFIYTTAEADFIRNLPNVDLAWVISSRNPAPNTAALVKACREFHESGGGLYIWADNDPYFQHANAILNDLLNVTLAGNTPGDKTLSFGEAKTSGHFGSHLITSGITNLYEGITICYPKPSANSILQTIATSTNNNPVVLVAEQGEKGLKNTSGRIVVDCGFTKLYHKWDTAGTARYVVNANVWLLGLDHKMKHGLALSRVAAK